MPTHRVKAPKALPKVRAGLVTRSLACPLAFYFFT